jgi:hypothetical protein
MSVTLLIHVGPWKTGSTSIQSFLAQNRDNLLGNGILYPVGVVESNAHHEVPNLLLGSMSRFEHRITEKRLSLNRVLEKYQDDAKSSNCSRILLSSEDFFALSLKDYKEFISMLGRIGISGIELIWLEPDPDERKSALKSQYVLSGEHVDAQAENLIVDRFKKNIRDFREIVEELNLKTHTINYNRVREGNSLLSNFVIAMKKCEKEELDPPLEFTEVWLNESLHPDTLEVINRFNHLNRPNSRFDFSTPIFSSRRYSREKQRFTLVTHLAIHHSQLQNAIAERDAAIARMYQ